jgi:hypothetical protein
MKLCIRSGFGPALALVALASALPSSADVVPASALRGMKALFVVGEDRLRDDENKEHHSDDRLVKAHLEALGFVVKVARESEPPSAATGQDLVVISSTVDENALKDAYKNVAVPVLTWSAYSYPHMAMTGSQAHRDFEVLFKGVQGALYRRSLAYGYAYATNAVNPIAKAAGVPNLLFGLMGLEDGKCWGRPYASADTVVTFEGDSGKAAVFTYDKGALMYGGFVAPARRVGFPLDNDSFHSLTSVLEGSPGDRDRRIKEWYVGRKLFDAAVRWAVTPPPPPPEAAQTHGALAKAAPGKKVLFLERTNFAEGREADANMVAYLRSLGFAVTVVDAQDPEMPTDGLDLIILSATLSKHAFGNKYWDTRVPLLAQDGVMGDNLRFTGRSRPVQFGEHGEWDRNEDDEPKVMYFELVNSGHPLAGGVAPGLFPFTKEPGVVKFDVPLPGAITIATLPSSPDHAAIFGYEKGATMAEGFVTPARRVMFNLDNPSFDDLTDQGRMLYDATLLWLISTPEQ